MQDTNETLFYRLLNEHLVEMLPVVYTPTVGDACEHFSDIYRRARGIFVSYDNRHYFDEILHSVTKDKIRVVVITDGERVLGLGDQVLAAWESLLANFRSTPHVGASRPPIHCRWH